MSNTPFYKDLSGTGNVDSELSDIGPEDLASIVKGAEDMDDVLFGFKTKQPPDYKSKKSTSMDIKTSQHPKSAVLDFPDGDPLADISLSDDDFYDVGKTSPIIKKKESNIYSPTNSPNFKSNQSQLTKSQKIADLFGLDNEEVTVVEKKKNQENAGDWLGIKDSPIKTIKESENKDKPFGSVRKTSITDILDPGNLAEEINISVDNKKKNLLEINNTGIRSFKESERLGSATIKQAPDQNKIELSNVRPTNLSSDFNFPKTQENLKDKKSAIFEELFGDDHGQKVASRRNSTVENIDAGSAGAVVSDDLFGQYTPSSGASRRPGLGRRKDTKVGLTSTALLKEDWLGNLDQPSRHESKKESSKNAKTETTTSGVEADGLPTWLGGTSLKPDTKPQKITVQAGEEKVVEKIPEKQPGNKLLEIKPPQNLTEDKDMADTIKEALSGSSEQTNQTVLALQRTEAQLTAALELQTSQKSLEAVCARQHQLLSCQEKQVAQLVSQQVNRQSEVERQTAAQQQRIQVLLEALSTNILPSASTFEAVNYPVEETVLDKRSQERNELKEQLQIVSLENEELRLRMKLMEKHYKMEFESFQSLHRKEIEFWEDQLIKQKELTEQMKEDFKEKIEDLKQTKAELIAEHNERVNRLREESAEDMKQLVQIHKTTFEQITVFSKLVTPSIREENKPSIVPWKPLDNHELSEKEEELIKKERILTALEEKLKNKKELFDKQMEEKEATVENDKMKNEEILRQLKQEQVQLKYKQQQMIQEKKHIEDQYHVQRKLLEEMQEKVRIEQTDVATQRLVLTEERARLEALAKLQGVSGSSNFDIVQSKAEVHGALEAAREAEMRAVEEGRKLKEKDRAVDNYRWKLHEMEKDLVTRAEHMDRLMQVSEAKEEAGKKALEEAKALESSVEEKMKEVERRKLELREKEQSLIRIKLDIAHEEIRINKKKEQLEHFLPHLLPEESLPLQPLKDVIDPKMLIMKLRAEREFEAVAKS